ncbi:hypothetical protein [Croceicoccus sp. YJ47]|uniref:hypothetical protein n=1 Tax=Croceicoccus sp. YJ47 TaxID=2798724 RepID=UPI0019246547|nr:hypothetical protein [Croceicoccus sp. YJ47]QQN74160.1 hypothetical protein JD971_15805 [Croceicoccus sp. YJ47]
MSAIEWLTSGLLVATVIYAGLTYWLAQTTAKQVWENNRAILIATLSLHQGGNMIHLVIKNIGRGPARQCRLTVDSDVHSTFGGKTLRETVAFKRTIEALPIDFEWHYGLGQPHLWLGSDDRENFPLLFNVTVEYESGGKLITDCFAIDLEALLQGPSNRDDGSRFFFDMPQKYERQSNALNSGINRIAKSLNALQLDKKPVPFRSWSKTFRRSSSRHRR